MKKILLTLSVAAMLGMGMTSCNNQPQKNDTQDSSTKGSIADSQADMKIAYVEVDSIMSQYQYWKDVMKLMQGKEANIQKTLQGKQQSLQQAAANFQQGIQSNKFSRDEAQQIQANLQMQAQEGDQLQQRLSNEYQKEVSKYNQALSPTVSTTSSPNTTRTRSLRSSLPSRVIIFSTPTMPSTSPTKLSQD